MRIAEPFKTKYDSIKCLIDLVILCKQLQNYHSKCTGYAVPAVPYWAQGKRETDPYRPWQDLRPAADQK